MTSALYLEHYLDSLQHLPVELQRNFKLMRDLDNRAQLLMRTIDQNAAEFLDQLDTTDPDVMRNQVDNIQQSFNKAKEYGDDKVQLAIQTYELVDKHIRRLDSDLARFEADIQDKTMAARAQAQEPDGAAHRKQGRKKSKADRSGAVAKKKREGSSEDEPAPPARTAKKKQQRKPAAAKETEDADSSAATHPSEVLDMPVDPNEPTYCLCHQVSYGEMIGCDNSDCTIEWFHFACVGLTIKPKGKWYCPKCTQDRKRK